MISLIPCYSIEDFSLYRKASDVDEIFSAWSCLYHPALVAHFGDAPRWEAAGSPSSSGVRRLIVVPPCAEYLVSHKWIKEAEAQGAIVIRNQGDRESILAEAFERLGISPEPTTSDESEFERNDAVDSFLAVGLCCFMEELLTRKLRYMSNLDQVSFNTRILEASRAHMSGDVDEREKGLQKAFDLLAQSKEYFFPTATKFIDLTRVQSEDLADALPKFLLERRARDEKSNLVLPAPVLKICRRDFPQTLALVREELDAGRATLVGGDEWEAPLYLMTPMEIARILREGREFYREVLGTTPTIFGREEAGYAQILPQLLKLSGYKGALARTGDGWSLVEKTNDRTQIRWQSRDGSSIATICKKPLDASDSEEILQMPERIGNSYYSSDDHAVVFEHRPGKESRWLRDLLRMDRYSPVLGKFYDLNEYLRVTEGAGDKEKFVKDHFKTNFLTRCAKRNRRNPTSLWPLRRRLDRAQSSLNFFETTIRAATLRVKCEEGSTLDAIMNDFREHLAALRQGIIETLREIDAQLFPTNEENAPPEAFDVFARALSLEEKREELRRIAERLLAEASNARAERDDEEESAELSDEERDGFLAINASASEQETLFETRIAEDEEKRDELQKREEEIYVESQRQLERRTPGGALRLLGESGSTRRYSLSLPPGAYFWRPRVPGVEYNVLTRPTFDPEAPSAPLLSEADPHAPTPATPPARATSERGSFLKKLAAKFRDVPNSAPNQGSGADSTILAEYVEKRYSAQEIDRYYRLRNEYLELRIDPVTGAVRRLTTATNATFSDGLMRQPSLGNRFAWDVAFKLPSALLSEDRRPQDDAGYGYSNSAADAIEILSRDGGIGRIRVKGRLVTPAGELAAVFTETISLAMRGRIVDVDLEIAPQLEPDASPWDSYFCSRFAWKDALAELSGGVAYTLIGTQRDYFQAPECVDIHSSNDTGITILGGGLPYFLKRGDCRMDAILIPKGETRRRFRFGIGIDLADPQGAALSYADAPMTILENAPRPRRRSGAYVSTNALNAALVDVKPIVGPPNEGASSVRNRRLNDDLRGAQVTLLETSGIATDATLTSRANVASAELVDLEGKPLKETVEVKNGATIPLSFKPRQLRVLRLYFDKR